MVTDSISVFRNSGILRFGVLLLCHTLFVKALNMNDCLEVVENTLCYHCDSLMESYCGDPFQYSQYYSSGYKNVYLTECQGCCLKIVHPVINGTRRIQRTCTELVPEVTFPMEPNCSDGDERIICICNRGLCNGANYVTPTGLIQIFILISNLILAL